MEVNPLAYGEFYKPIPQKTMSQLRADILESLEEYLQEQELFPKGEKINQDKPVSYLELDPEQQFNMLVFIEKKWNIVFHEDAAMEFAKNTDTGTTSDLITIIIRIMNGPE